MNTKRTILVVDDEPTNLDMIGQLLSPHYTIRVANSGDRMMKVVVTDPRPDLILLDVMMPKMSGYTAIKKLKENIDTQNIPVIFITAMDEEENEEKGLSLGAVDYITKPIRPAILLARIKTHLQLKHAHDRLQDQNSCLEAEVSRRMEENQIIQNASIRALAHLAEMRDSETGAHILRTQGYVKILAEHLQPNPRFTDILTSDFIYLLTKSAPLHDIGKVGIPDDILLKPGKLTAAEWTIMKTHSAIGAQALAYVESDIDQPIEFLKLAKEIAHWHHERWDGTGYPDNLSGDDIPVSARIMAIADVFDALISRRVYKAEMSFEKAKEIMLAERCRQFDPDMIDTFLAKFEEFETIAHKYDYRYKS